jgi:quinol monooxygenase YgiN
VSTVESRFIQLVEFDSDHSPADVRQALDEWLVAIPGKRTLQTAIIATEHDHPQRFWELLEWESQEAAEATMELPETRAAYERWTSLLNGDPTFRNLDVVEHTPDPETP